MQKKQTKIELVNPYEHLPKEYQKQKQSYENYDELKIDLPFRAIVVGATGSGKTQTVFNIIKSLQAFTHLYIFAKDINEPLYKFIIDRYRKIGEKLKKSVITTSDTLDDVPAVEDFDPEEANLVVIDDMMKESKQALKKVEDIFIRGRRQNISVIWATQAYYPTPQIIRQNANYIFVLKVQSLNDLKRMMREYELDASPKTMLQMYQKTRHTKNSFLLIDLQTNDPALKYRNGWNPF